MNNFKALFGTNIVLNSLLICGFAEELIYDEN